MLKGWSETNHGLQSQSEGEKQEFARQKVEGGGSSWKTPRAQGWEKGIFCRAEEGNVCSAAFTAWALPCPGSSFVLLRAGAGPAAPLPELERSQLDLHQFQGKQTGWERVLRMLEGGACVCIPGTSPKSHRDMTHSTVGNCRHLSWGSPAFKKYLFYSSPKKGQRFRVSFISTVGWQWISCDSFWLKEIEVRSYPYPSP